MFEEGRHSYRILAGKRFKEWPNGSPKTCHNVRKNIDFSTVRLGDGWKLPYIISNGRPFVFAE